MIRAGNLLSPEAAMLKKQGRLTDALLRNIKPKERLYRLADGAGLSAEVHPNGSVYWRLRYRHATRQRMAGLGVWPEVSLAGARKAAAELRAHVQAGRDPVQARREAKREQVEAVGNSFEAVARDWLAHNPEHLAPVTLAKARGLLETYLFPTLGKRPVAEIKASEVLTCLRAPEKAGKLETAHRLRDRASAIFRWAIATDRAESDPTRDLKGALRAKVEKHRAALTDTKAVGRMLLKLDAYQGQYATRAALRLLALTFVRPGELRHAEWTEFDLDAPEPSWTIPGHKMKGRHLHAADRPAHLVPLSRQAAEILRELRHVTGRCRLVFPGVRKASTPMSINTLTAALRAIGYGKEQSAHGFRAVASTLLREQGHDPVLIEAQLAHKVKDKVEAAYNRAQHIQSRRTMMQAWADYLDTLREQARKED